MKLYTQQVNQKSKAVQEKWVDVGEVALNGAPLKTHIAELKAEIKARDEHIKSLEDKIKALAKIIVGGSEL